MRTRINASSVRSFSEHKRATARKARRRSADLWRVLTLDTVTVAVIDHRGRRSEAALVAPTHPLRVLWFAAWAETGAQWLAAARQGPAEFVVATRDALLRQLAPVGHPAGLGNTRRSVRQW